MLIGSFTMRMSIPSGFALTQVRLEVRVFWGRDIPTPWPKVVRINAEDSRLRGSCLTCKRKHAPCNRLRRAQSRMKKCSYCGKEYPDEASFCAIDRTPLRDVVAQRATAMPSQGGERQQIIDDEHIRLLAIFHFVVAGLAFVGMGFLIFHYLVMSSVFSNPEIWKAQKGGAPFPKDFMKVFIWFYIVLGFILAMASSLNLASAIFLRQKRHRIFSMVVGGLNCFQIPFGTVLGVFTLVVLLRDSVRQRYAG